MAAPSTNYPTKNTTQELVNDSFDKDFSVIAVETLGYDSANNVMVRMAADSSGRSVMAGSIRANKVQQATTITSSTGETTVLTQVASTYLDVYGVIVTNTSTTACEVIFKDSTSGTSRFSIEVPGTETRGFMLPESGGHNQDTVNNNWTATCGTSVSSIKITMFAIKNT